MIPYGRHEVTDEDIKSVVDVLKSDFLTQGPVVLKFEEKWKPLKILFFLFLKKQPEPWEITAIEIILKFLYR